MLYANASLMPSQVRGFGAFERSDFARGGVVGMNEREDVGLYVHYS